MVFDVGANRGQTAIELNARFPTAEIHAFEPDPATFRELQKTTQRLAKVRTHCMGLGSENTTATLHVTKSSEGSSFLQLDETRTRHGTWASHQSDTIATVRRMDAFCCEQRISFIDLVKIDTQGFESEVIDGGGDFFCSQNIRVVMLEVNLERLYKGQAEFSEVFRCLDARGFRLVDFYNKSRSSDGKLSWCDAVFSSGSLPAGDLPERNHLSAGEAALSPPADLS